MFLQFSSIFIRNVPQCPWWRRKNAVQTCEKACFKNLIALKIKENSWEQTGRIKNLIKLTPSKCDRIQRIHLKKKTVVIFGPKLNPSSKNGAVKQLQRSVLMSFVHRVALIVKFSHETLSKKKTGGAASSSSPALTQREVRFTGWQPFNASDRDRSINEAVFFPLSHAALCVISSGRAVRGPTVCLIPGPTCSAVTSNGPIWHFWRKGAISYPHQRGYIREGVWGRRTNIAAQSWWGCRLSSNLPSKNELQDDGNLAERSWARTGGDLSSGSDQVQPEISLLLSLSELGHFDETSDSFHVLRRVMLRYFT